MTNETFVDQTNSIVEMLNTKKVLIEKLRRLDWGKIEQADPQFSGLIEKWTANEIKNAQMNHLGLSLIEMMASVLIEKQNFGE